MTLPAAHRNLLLQLAAEYGTPTYVYFLDVISRQVRTLRKHLEGVPVDLLYAMKANAQPTVLRHLLAEGVGVDAVSPGELLLARQLGFQPKDILYSANNMTDEEMHTAHKAGVLLNIGEVSRLDRYGAAYPGAEVSVRLNPMIGAGHHEHVVTAGKKTKFGTPVAEIDAVKAIAECHGLRIIGLHQHIGSGIPDTNVLADAMQVLLEAGMAFPELRFMNFGGGFNVPYKPDDAALDFENFATRIVAPLKAYHAAHPSPNLTFRFEPGRFFVAQCGVLLTQVNTLKSAYGRHFAGCDTGMGHLLRPAMYGAYHAISNLSNPEGPLQSYDVVGNICETADTFARDREVATIREGDVLAIHDAGAYGMAMATLYNLRPLPAEVAVQDGAAHLVQPRMTEAELIARLLADARPMPQDIVVP